MEDCHPDAAVAGVSIQPAQLRVRADAGDASRLFFASWAGMIPGTILYVYIGSLSGDLARAAGGSARRTPAGWALTVVGFVATVAVVVYATRIGARALREKT